METGSLEVLLLGPVRARLDGRTVDVGGPKRRSVLAALALSRGRVVSTDAIAEELWGESTPPTARTAIHGHLSGLRKLLPPGRIATEGSGYSLTLGSDELDLARFEELVDAGATALSAKRPDEAASILHRAEALWRGAPLGDVELQGASSAEVSRIEELRSLARQRRLEAELALGRHLEVLTELETLTRAEPWDERLRSLLVIALYRSGRQADALDACRELRENLRDELGVDPGPEFQQLEVAILQQDPSLTEVEPPIPRAVDREAAPRVLERKLVTFVVGRISLETGPAAPAAALEGLTRNADDIVRAHGGRLEPTAKDRIIATFGVEEQHEDDATRGAAAAIELSERLVAGFDSSLRLAVSTGHVQIRNASVNGPLGETRPLRVAAALAGSAADGEIFVDGTTVRLSRGAIVAEPLRSGLRHPALHEVRAFRVRGRAGPDTPPSTGVPLVGRSLEHAMILQSFERASLDRSSHLFTLLGAAGVGKTRLTEEFIAGISRSATVLSGRCLPYGSDITYWPVASIVRQAADVADEDPPGVVRSKLAGILQDLPDGVLIGERLGALLGFPGATTTPEETAWAVRKLLEGLAANRPLVLILDDLHWADRTLLGLIRQVAGSLRNAPVLFLCLARSEFADDHADWGGGRLNSTTALLARLTDQESEDLIDAVLGRGLSDRRIRSRVVAVAEGNPLFLIEMLSMLVDDGSIRRGPHGWEPVGSLDAMRIPPTVEAVLGARLDRLTEEERLTIERAAVIGKEFSLASVVDLLPESLRPRTPDVLESLVRRELISEMEGPESSMYRFHHLLVRDVAYAALPLGVRARLHEAFASRLEQTSADRIAEVEEIVGYHLESAYRSQEELGTEPELLVSFGTRAGEHLAASGSRSFARDDVRATRSLLDRAIQLLPKDHPMLPSSLRRLGVALGELGEWTRMEAVLGEAIQRAEARGDLEETWFARIELVDFRLYYDPAVDGSSVLVVADEAIEALSDVGGPVLARALRLRGDALVGIGQQALAQETFLRGADVAKEAGDERELRLRAAFAVALGPMPAAEAIPVLEEHVAGLEPFPGMALVHLAYLYAMDGRREDAMAAIARNEDATRDLGSEILHATHFMYAGVTVMLLGDIVEAERALATGVAILQRLEERYLLSTAAVLLAQTVLAQGRSEEALRLVELSESITDPDDPVSQMISLGIRARILTDQGSVDEAEARGRRATEIGAGTDFLNHRADAHTDLAHVLFVAGRIDEAISELETALRLLEQKGNVLAAERTEELLARYRDGSNA